MNYTSVSAGTRATAVAVLSLLSVVGCSGDNAADLTGPESRRGPQGLPTFAEVQGALDEIVGQENAGLGFNMWATMMVGC